MNRINHPSLSSSQPKVGSTPIAGLHIVANLEAMDIEKLSRSLPFKNFVNSLIEKYQLVSVGEIFHEFDQGGFTAVICLTESHLSVHTWPENNYLTFDIYLSNHLKDNRKKTEDIYQEVVAYFDAVVLFENFIQR